MVHVPFADHHAGIIWEAILSQIELGTISLPLAYLKQAQSQRIGKEHFELKHGEDSGAAETWWRWARERDLAKSTVNPVNPSRMQKARIKAAEQVKKRKRG